jgi:hypothetical protein
MFRQGDLLFVEVNQIPLDVEPASAVLALGETTGHKHRATGQLEVLKQPRGPVFLRGSGQIMHEEHAPLQIPEGLWTMQRQREYEAGTHIGRQVSD